MIYLYAYLACAVVFGVVITWSVWKWQQNFEFDDILALIVVSVFWPVYLGLCFYGWYVDTRYNKDDNI